MSKRDVRLNWVSRCISGEVDRGIENYYPKFREDLPRGMHGWRASKKGQ